jgi:hypothetical protein
VLFLVGGCGITKMMAQQDIGEDFDVVEGGYVGETN